MGVFNGGYVVAMFLLVTKISNGNVYSTDLARLHDALFSAAYSSDVIPIMSHDNPVVVRMFPVMVKLDNGITVGDDIQPTFSITMAWSDYRLRWAVLDFNNINKIYVPLRKLWRPDLIAHNEGQGHNENLFDENDLAVVSHSGLVTYTCIINLKFLCSSDYFEFPFDKSQCYLKIGSWLYSARQIKLEFLHTNKTAVPIDSLLYGTRSSTASDNTCQWKLVHEKAQGFITNITHDCCPDDPSTVLEIIMHLRRNPRWKGTVLILLVVVMAIFIPLQFCISPNLESRLTHGYVSLVVSSLSIAYLMYVMPASQIQTTKIGISILGYVSISVVAVVASVAIQACTQRSKDGKPPPACLVQVAMILSPICCVKTGTQFPRNRQKASNPYTAPGGPSDEYRPDSIPLQGGTQMNRGHLDLHTYDATCTSDRLLDNSSFYDKLSSIEEKLSTLLEFINIQQHSDWFKIIAVIDRMLLVIFSVLSLIFLIYALQ